MDMGKYFDVSESLFDITRKYPETVAVFTSNGFPQMEDAGQRESFGKMITFEAALQLKQKNPDTFLGLLNEVISAKRENVDATLAQNQARDETGLNIVGLLPCPVRIPLLEQYGAFAEEFSQSSPVGLNTELKAASMGTDWVAANIDGVTSAAALPDLFISAGFDLFFDRDRIGRFRDRGDFADLVPWDRDNPLFAGRGLRDPQKNYSIVAIVPAVFLVNQKELNGRNIPQSWQDILQPEWEQSVSLPVGDFDLFNAILLNIHDTYGDAGVRQLGRSMLDAMHPSQMVRSDRQKVRRPAVTIMPYFFTKTVKEGGPMSAVWPADGAIVSPIFMLAKRERADALQPVVDFFASREVGETLAHTGLFPSLHPEVDNRLSPDTPLMWLGWEKIMEKDLSAEIKACHALFDGAVK
jgi:ABC-type Fe3+ transport system substrate-binding protein